MSQFLDSRHIVLRRRNKFQERGDIFFSLQAGQSVPREAAGSVRSGRTGVRPVLAAGPKNGFFLFFLGDKARPLVKEKLVEDFLGIRVEDDSRQKGEEAAEPKSWPPEKPGAIFGDFPSGRSFWKEAVNGSPASTEPGRSAELRRPPGRPFAEAKNCPARECFWPASSLAPSTIL
jgi:hypothetical protein